MGTITYENAKKLYKKLEELNKEIKQSRKHWIDLEQKRETVLWYLDEIPEDIRKEARYDSDYTKIYTHTGVNGQRH